MIQLRHRQASLWHSGLAKDIEDLREPWMKVIEELHQRLMELAREPGVATRKITAPSWARVYIPSSCHCHSV